MSRQGITWGALLDKGAHHHLWVITLTAGYRLLKSLPPTWRAAPKTPAISAGSRTASSRISRNSARSNAKATAACDAPDLSAPTAMGAGRCPGTGRHFPRTTVTGPLAWAATCER